MVGLSTPGGTRYCTGGTVVNPPDHKNVITILWSFPTRERKRKGGEVVYSKTQLRSLVEMKKN
jgi:hypothetical protein